MTSDTWLWTYVISVSVCVGVCVFAERVMTQRPFIHPHVATAGQLSHPPQTKLNPTVSTLI